MDATEPILGIDLGTTNSVAAIYRNGQAEVLEEDGQALLPSVVGVDDSGRLLVGTPARNQLLLAPERTVKSIKRKMGQDTTVRLGKTSYTPQEISAIILRTLKERASRQLGREVRKAVITVPAFFNETQRQATHEAGELAGLEVVRIINEPTAAALTYECHPERMERLLVYDLGGGTFDVSVVQIEQGVVEVLASHGDTQLGGDDFDQLLLDHVCDRFEKKHGVDPRKEPASQSRLLYAVEEAKKKLSFEPVVRIEEEFLLKKNNAPLHMDMEVSRLEYEPLILPLLEKTLRLLDESLRDAKVEARQIDYVVLVGGASRTPLVHQLLVTRLGQPLHMEVDPDLCVAMGAAIQGALIAGVDAGPVLVDITPHTLGIQALLKCDGMIDDNHFAAIIERNTALPVSRSEMFLTAVDGQKEVVVSVFQGESDDVRFNDRVGEFALAGLADVAAGNQLQVSFQLNLDGILTVSAVERMTGLMQKLVIENSMNRFRKLNREAARGRLERAFQTFIDESGTAVATKPAVLVEADDDVPEEIQQLSRQADHLIVRAERLGKTAPAEDGAEIDRQIGQLRSALGTGDAAEIRKCLAPLDDLVFYLEDA